MKLEIFRTADAKSWHSALTGFVPDDDVYFSPGYFAACEANGDGEARGYLVRSGGAALFLPLLSCKIPGSEELFDLQSPYGYGGPLVTGGDETFLAEAWRLLVETWKREGAVAAFLRCHPLADNGKWIRGDWKLRVDRETRAVGLSEGIDAAFSGPDGAKHRRDSARAMRDGVQVRRYDHVEPPPLASFRTLYADTMLRLGATDAYFFSDAYFEVLGRSLAGRISLFEAADASGEISCAALILWGPTWAHYHLSGRQPAAANASHLLLTVVSQEACARGLQALHLGGGRTASPDDSLLRFKTWIGRDAHRFHTAGIVLDAERYRWLLEKWKRAHPDAVPTWTLAYRQPADLKMNL